MSARPQAATRTGGAGAWVLGALVASALVTMYAPVAASLASQWWSDPNYRHCMAVPLIAGFLLYRRRAGLAGTRSADGATPGFVLVVLASGMLVVGTAAAELFTARASIPTMILGLTLVFCGREFTRRALFPLLFLYLMVPLPYIFYYKLTFPLQLLSAKLSAGTLGALGVSVYRRGNVLELPAYSLEVVEACSGLRSVMTMITLALVMGALVEMKSWGRAVLAVCAVPVAIAANAMRLVVTGLGAYLVSNAFADGFLHQLSGLVVFATGFVALLVLVGIVRRWA